ncbi:MAG: Mur ligase family protein [Lactobacillus sp.]|nr:Mur ligase family protein [Lactobacillus sp.]
MNLRAKIAKLAGQSSHFVLQNIFHGGTSFPGKIATKIDPAILDHLSADYETIIVTGTNGKTMTTSLIVKALSKKYGHILTNPSGSNMQQGITTAFITGHNSKSKRKIAVLEVDEANVKKVTQLVKPKAFVLTNIFRDQMDRYGEIYTTYEKIVDGIKLSPEATVIFNADANIFSSVDLPNPKVTYGFKLPEGEAIHAPVNTDGVLCPKCQHILEFKSRVYANLGSFICPNCHFSRPELDYWVEKIIDEKPNHLEFEIGQHNYQLALGGTFNIYNALAAYATARTFGVTDDEIDESFNNNLRIFGRQELIKIGNHDINLILVKNPVGLDEVIRLIDTETDQYSLVALLNANHADGIDTSWIWDAQFEQMNQTHIKATLVGGLRYEDMALRLRIAGFDKKAMTVESDFNKLSDRIKELPEGKVYILSTYTAMLDLRKQLREKGYLK